MSQFIRLRTQRAGALRAGALRAPVLFSAVSLAALLGCSGDVVNLGEDANPPPTPPSYSRCVDSPTLAGDVLVSEQAQLDALEGCETIQGDLHVLPWFQADLRPLHALKVVVGQLAFATAAPNEDEPFGEPYHDDWLGSFEGLEALTSVGSLAITATHASDLVPLSGLRELTGKGELSLALSNVRDLAPLGQLRGIRGLKAGGPHLESIADLQLQPTLNVLWLEGETLTEIDSLRQVREVRGQLILSRLRVHDLTSLSNLQSVGALTVHQMPFLESLNGLEQLTEAPDEVFVVNNPLLESVEGLTSLQATDTLWIEGNPRLRQVPDFPALLPTRGLIISNNATLEEISGFFVFGEAVWRPSFNQRTKLYARADVIEISRNPALRSFALPVGWEGGKDVEIVDNASLETLDLAEFEAIDLLSITRNPSLRNVDLGLLGRVDTLNVISNPLLSPSTFDAVQTFEREMTGNAGQPPTPTP